MVSGLVYRGSIIARFVRLGQELRDNSHRGHFHLRGQAVQYFIDRSIVLSCNDRILAIRLNPRGKFYAMAGVIRHHNVCPRAQICFSDSDLAHKVRAPPLRCGIMDN